MTPVHRGRMVHLMFDDPGAIPPGLSFSNPAVLRFFLGCEASVSDLTGLDALPSGV